MAAGKQYFHGMDALRGILMLSVVPYHVIRSYGDNDSYGVQSPDTSLGLELIGDVIHSFHMEAFFVLSGMVAALVLARMTARDFLTSRAMRLGLPMLVCLLLFPLAGRPVVKALIDAGLATPAASAELLAPGSLWWVQHLWYLGVLMMVTLAYTLAVVLVERWPPAAALAARLGGFLTWLTRRRFAVSGLVLAMLVTGFWLAAPQLTRLAALFGLSTQPLGPLFSFEQAVRFGPFFLFGTALWLRPDVRLWFCRPEPLALPLALVGSAIFVSRYYVPMLNFGALVIGVGLASVFWTQALVSFAVRFMDAPSPTRTLLSDSSYSIYLFHYPIVMLLCLVFVGIALPPVVEFAIITVMAGALSFGLYSLVRRSAILELLFHGKPLKRRAMAVP